MSSLLKLQPNRTMHLRGFDDRGAAAAFHSATADSFTVSGVFRDPADFSVLMLWDADDFFGHPRIKWLPDFAFDGMVLQFDVQYSGLQPLDTVKFPVIDNTFLDVVRADAASSKTKIPLFDHAELVGGDFSAARGTVRVSVSDSVAAGDRIALWYLNNAWEYIAPGTAPTAAEVASAIAALVNGTNWTAQGVSLAIRATAVADQITIVAARYGLVNTAGPVVTLASGMPFTGMRPGQTIDIAGVRRAVLSVDSRTRLTLSEDPGNLTGVAYLADRGGADGNTITMYATSRNATSTGSGGLAATPGVIPLAGGNSEVTWRVTLDFSALGIDQIRQCWFTFAPLLADGAAYEATEWQALFTNWKAIADPNSRRPLQVAGPGSVRIEDSDGWCTYKGTSWKRLNSNQLVDPSDGFFSRGFVMRASTAGDSVTVKYACDFAHELWLGTSLYTDRGTVSVVIDNQAAPDLDCHLETSVAITARRRLVGSVPAGEHVVKLTLAGPGYFYFDFIEAVVRADPGEQPMPSGLLRVSPALDYDTDHSYKLPPARLMWMMDRLGFAGPINEYVGVFWWNQRKRLGASIAALTLTFRDAWAAGVQVFVDIGAPDLSTYTAFGKTVFAGDTPANIAAHLAYFINAISTGVWAEASGAALTITVRSPTSAYRFGHRVRIEGTGAGAVSELGSLTGSVAGRWDIDVDASPAINRGARDWHADLFRECKARGLEVTAAFSMELLNPPDAFAARFPDGTAVTTATGFATNFTTHCAFRSDVLAYQKRAYKDMADLQVAAGLPVVLQFGEFLWWFFRNSGAVSDPGVGMAYYDSETKSAALAALGRALYQFKTPDDNPLQHQADADFLRGRLVAHMAAIREFVRVSYPSAEFEVLLPLDVNYPEVYGVYDLGGRLNYYVNIPDEFRSPAAAPFDRVKMEGLDFGSGSRDLDKALRCARFPFTEGSWPREKCRYLIAVFNGGCPWPREQLQTIALGLASYHFWAWDHVNLFGWPLGEPDLRGAANLE